MANDVDKSKARIIGKAAYEMSGVRLTFPQEWTPQGILEETKRQFVKQAMDAGKFDAVDHIHAFLTEPCAAAVFMLAAQALTERDEVIERQARLIADLGKTVQQLESRVKKLEGTDG